MGSTWTLRACVALLALAGRISAEYSVEFWGNSNCAGAPLGTFDGGAEAGCQTLGVGEAEGATVTGSDDMAGAVVVFYSSSTCDISTALAEANTGCVAIDSFADSYRSFNVIYGEEKRSDGLKTRSVTGTIAENPYGYHHGHTADYSNQTYVWHQVASNAWRGITPSEWDDHIHVQNFSTLLSTPLIPLPQTTVNERAHSRDISLREPAELFDRSFVYASCTFVANCVLATIDGTSYAVSNVAQSYVAAANNQAAGQAIWNFLNQPLVIALTVEVGNAALSGAVSAITASKLPASTCSTEKTDADTIQQIITGVANRISERAVQVGLQIADNAESSISIEAVPTGQRGDGNTCGAPSTDPTTGG